ncbi:hypothetical protein CC78DRAFT_575800 [Lojkania enalia]|uniref:Uncharacterized protein n=1 Tax=Lojkania enalia TaxID=147567 RepID=A0A9P4N8D6_9PLEO|nr:hypothetical protein CC78DRAFT_575800 [Didymosphaeria enalia]
MPYCHTCGEVFEGRGIYCIYHIPRAFNKTPDPQNTYYATESPSNVKYRTNKYRSNGYDTSNTGLSSFPSTHIYLPTLQAAATQFQSLATDYTINNMTFHISPSGTRSIQVSANKDREQCYVCKKWFPDRRRLEQHQWELGSGCEIHEMCFSKEEEHYHGTMFRHDRCFVRGCASIYRREGGWKSGVVENHVREWHQ